MLLSQLHQLLHRTYCFVEYILEPRSTVADFQNGQPRIIKIENGPGSLIQYGLWQDGWS